MTVSGRLGAHTALYLVSRLVPAGLTFLALGAYTRLLDPDAYGLYALVMSVVLLVSTLAVSWIYLPVVRMLPANPDPRRFQAAVLLAFLGMVGLAVVVGGPILAFQAPTAEAARLYALGGVLLVAQSWLEINLNLLVARGEAGLYARIAIGRSILATGAGIALTWAGGGPAGILGGLIVGAVGPAVWLTLRHWRGVRVTQASRDDLKAIGRYGLPLSLSFTLDNIIFYSDRVLLGWLIGAGTVGLYAVGYDIADKALKSIMYSVGAATLPAAVLALERHGTAAARDQLERNVVMLFTLGVPAAVGLAAVAPEVSVLVGAEYRDAVAALVPPIAAATFFACLRSNYFDHAFHLGKSTLPLMVVTAVTALANVALNLLLIPRMGIQGAVWATLASFLIGCAGSYGLGRRLFRLPLPWGEFAKIAVAAAGMAAVVLALPTPMAAVPALILKAAVGAAVYAALAMAMNVQGTRFLRARVAR